MADSQKVGNLRLRLPLYQYIKETAKLSQRTIPGQIEYWIILGEILEKKFSDKEIKDMVIEFTQYNKNY